jgi:hypothetical protein
MQDLLEFKVISLQELKTVHLQLQAAWQGISVEASFKNLRCLNRKVWLQANQLLSGANQICRTGFVRRE